MFRFTIRDLLWLMVVAALATCWYRDRMLMAATMEKSAAELTAEREKLKADMEALAVKRREIDARFKSATEAQKQWSKLVEHAKINAARNRPPPPTDEELEQIKSRASDLGAPQPKPLPPGYGEKLN
jgi:hypothetical protein